MSMKPITKSKKVDYYKGKETGLGALCGVSNTNETNHEKSS